MPKVYVIAQYKKGGKIFKVGQELDMKGDELKSAVNFRRVSEDKRDIQKPPTDKMVKGAPVKK